MRRRVAGFALAAIVAALGWVIYTEPHIRAYLCPSCAGFREIAPRIYVDAQANDADIDLALQSLEQGKAMVMEFYPARTSSPIWLLCLSGQCGVQAQPRPKAMAYMNMFVFVYPDGVTPTILAHELAHTELHHRAGSYRRLTSQAVPTWFDEGLAVYISRDTRYLNVQDGVVTGCKAGDWPVPPADQRVFRRRAATETEELYTASACKTIAWLDRHGGPEAVIDTLARIRAGGAFDD